MRTLLLLLSFILVSQAQATDLPTFMKEMSANTKFRKFIEREFWDWDENEDGRLDYEDGAVGKDGLFLSEAIFKKVDTSQSRSVSIVEYLEYQIAESYYALDTDRDGVLSAKEKQRIANVNAFFDWLDDGTLSFIVKGDTAYLNGTIKSRVVKQFRQLFAEHPQVKKLVFGWMPGSADDERMLEAMDLILAHGVDTHAADHARLQSGAVDLFTVGKKRTVGEDVQFGVHSWASGKRREGHKLPRHHKEHRPYVEYYQKVEVPVDFYWFTLEAAVADSMHIMTKEELLKYRIISSSQ